MISSRKGSLLAAAMTLAFGAAVALAQSEPDPIAEIEAALARGDGIAAEMAGKRLLAEGADRAALAGYIGAGELLQGDLRDAREWLGTGEFTPETAQRGFHALGRLEMAGGYFPEAAAAFDKALAMGEPTPEIWVDIGRLRYASGQQLLARDAAMRAVELGPQNPRALEFMGQLVRDAEGLRSGLIWFARGVVAAPEDLAVMKEYAATLGELGRAKDMLRITRTMISLDPNNADAFFLQAVLAARAGKMDLARRLMWRTGNEYDEVPAGIVLNGLLELHAGNARLAVEQFSELARRQPDNARVRLLLAHALYEAGDAREVVAEFEQEADGEGASPYLLVLVARSHELLGERAAAARYLDRANRAGMAELMLLPPGMAGELALFRWGENPEIPQAMVAAIRQRLEQQDLAGASNLVSQLERRYPASSDVQVLAGDVALVARDPDRALMHYGEAAKVRRNFALVRCMAEAHLMANRLERADTVVRDHLYQHPRDSEAAAFGAWIAARRGDRDSAATLAQFAAQTGEGPSDPQVQALLAETELELGRLAEAEEAVRRAHWLHRANMRVASVFSRFMREKGGHEAEADALLVKVRSTAADSSELPTTE